MSSVVPIRTAAVESRATWPRACSSSSRCRAMSVISTTIAISPQPSPSASSRWYVARQSFCSSSVGAQVRPLIVTSRGLPSASTSRRAAAWPCSPGSTWEKVRPMWEAAGRPLSRSRAGLT
ncbi:hypothetical protein GA0115253_1103711 [Streptomyces sp. Termitarium-T10T-6]|nr:hypothetical protein GA0115253_1103711 [Streptomyces sp. Termitarium-T10T-6]